MKGIRKVIIVTALCGVAMGATASATAAQSPAAEGYDETRISLPPPPAEPPPALPGSPTDGPRSARPTGGLPFTGLGLPFLAILGGLLLGAGVMIRHRTGSLA